MTVISTKLPHRDNIANKPVGDLQVMEKGVS